MTNISHNCKKGFEDLPFYLISYFKQQKSSFVYGVQCRHCWWNICCLKLRLERSIRGGEELALPRTMCSPIKLWGPQSAAMLQLLLQQIPVCLRRAVTSLERIFLPVFSQLQGPTITAFNPLRVHSFWTTISFCSSRFTTPLCSFIDVLKHHFLFVTDIGRVNFAKVDPASLLGNVAVKQSRKSRQKCSNKQNVWDKQRSRVLGQICQASGISICSAE